MPSASVLDRRSRHWGLWQPEGAQTERLRLLARSVRQVELKVLVETRSLRLLKSGPAGRIYFLDTEDRVLHRRGVIVRVRSHLRRRDDIVVKLRPMPHTTPDWLDGNRSFTVELDAMPGNYTCSGSLKEVLAGGDVDRAMRKGRSPVALLTPKQRRLIAEFAPKADPDTFITYGPIQARRSRLRLPGFDQSLCAEHWTFPNGRDVLELSARCSSRRAPDLARRLSATLSRSGIVPLDGQTLKTDLARSR